MKILASLLSALIFNFMFAVGLKIGYLDFFHINIYFNSFFMAKQPFIYLGFLIPTLLAFYLHKKAMLFLLAGLSIISISTFFFAKPIGKALYSFNASYQVGKHSVENIPVLLSHRGIDYVYFEDKQITKEFKTSNKIK